MLKLQWRKYLDQSSLLVKLILNFTPLCDLDNLQACEVLIHLNTMFLLYFTQDGKTQDAYDAYNVENLRRSRS